MNYTILGPGALTLDPASKQIQLADEQGNVGGQAPAPENGKVSRENVAEVITHVVDTEAAVRATVNFYDGSTPIAEAIS